MEDQIVQIKIHLESNIPGMAAGTIFTSDMLYMPPHEKSDGEEPIPKGQMPYFTVFAKYSSQSLQNSSRTALYRAFFDEQTFKRTFGKNLDGSLSDVDKHNNAMYNVQFMLNNLFPTTFPVKDNFHDTFQENIKRRGTNVTTTSSSNLFKKITDFFSGKDETQNDTVNGSIRYGGSTYSVVELDLLNDILNNPFYQPIIQQVRLFNQWRKKQIEILNTKISNVSTKYAGLFADLKKELTSTKVAEIDAEIDEIIKLFRGRSTGESPERFKRLFKQLKDANDEATVKSVLLDIEKINLAEGRSNRGYRSSIPTSFSEMRSYRYIQQWSSDTYFLTEKLKYISDMAEYIRLFSIRPEQLTPLDLKVRDEVKKYNELYSFVEKVKSFIMINSSSNPALQEKFKSVNKVILFFTEANTSKMDKKVAVGLADAYEVGLIQESSIALEKKEKEKSKQSSFSFSSQQHTCEIYVRLDVVKGLLNTANLSSIRCMYRNAALIQQYYKVTDKELNPLLLYKNKRLIDIDMLVKKGKTQKKRGSKQEVPVNRKRMGGFQPSLRSTPTSLSSEQPMENIVKKQKQKKYRKPVQRTRKNKKNGKHVIFNNDMY